MSDEATDASTAEEIEAELAATPALRLYVRVGDVGLAKAKRRMKADQTAARQVLRREHVAVPVRLHRDSLLTTSLLGTQEVS